MTAKWKTKNGTMIEIKDMSDSHIENCLIMIYRRLQRELENELLNAYAFAGSLRGEMAQSAAESACDEIAEETPFDTMLTDKTYKALVDEAKNRGIDWIPA